MKSLILLISVAAMTTSCQKDDMATPIGQSPNTELTNTVSQVDTSVYYLNWSCPSLGISLVDVPCTNSLYLTGYNASTAQNFIQGKMLNFYNSSGDVHVQIALDYNLGIIQSMGTVNGHSFITNINVSTINICGGQQNVTIVYSLTKNKINI